MNYRSTRKVTSSSTPGVEFTVARISFGRRLELTRQVRELGRKIEFQQAGESSEERLEAAIARIEVEKLYLRWGLIEIIGLEIDGVTATPELLIESGPEDLSREIAEEIRRECGLTEDERKN